jgi:hypothetical protein
VDIRAAGGLAGAKQVIVRYGDFYFSKDDGYLSLVHAPDPDSKDVVTVAYGIEAGDSLADLIAKVWVHQGAPPGVVATVRDV